MVTTADKLQLSTLRILIEDSGQNFLIAKTCLKPVSYQLHGRGSSLELSSNEKVFSSQTHQLSRKFFCERSVVVRRRQISSSTSAQLTHFWRPSDVDASKNDARAAADDDDDDDDNDDDDIDQRRRSRPCRLAFGV